MLLAFEIFGTSVPDFGVLVPIGILVILFLVFNRNGGLEAGGGAGAAGEVGTGKMFQCTRCGRNFQPASRQLLPNGQVRSEYDDRCPNCGWDVDWGDADDPNNSRKDSGGW